jgi:hypothetical protein
LVGVNSEFNNKYLLVVNSARCCGTLKYLIFM